MTREHLQRWLDAYVSRYYTDESRSELKAEYHNVYLMRFDDAGHCAAFTEYYIERP